MQKQACLTPDRLADAISKLNRQSLMLMAVNAKELAKPEATAAVADVCEAIALKLKTA
jgi:UDP-N-acetylglucosamine--N-acetylmuramyl-(pentapeptide) pyrophosphoryl-undecaprenol N-acetylglucosamine transferase